MDVCIYVYLYMFVSACMHYVLGKFMNISPSHVFRIYGRPEHKFGLCTWTRLDQVWFQLVIDKSS